MKKLLSLLIIVALCFGMVACASSQSPTVPSVAPDTAPSSESSSAPSGTTSAPTESVPAETDPPEMLPTEPEQTANGPLLYKVTDSNGNVIWLFGSIHVGREEFYPLPDYVMNAFEDAESLAVEADIVAFENDQAASTSLLMGMMYKDGTTLKDHIPAALYDRCVAILQENASYMPTMDMFQPYIWESMLQELTLKKVDADISLGIDRHLLEKAKADNKPILEVESVEFQLDLFAGFSEAMHIKLLEDAVKAYDDSEAYSAQLLEMMDIWQYGGEKTFSDYLSSESEDVPAEDQAMYAEYQKIVITDRNLSMTDWAEQALASGEKVFITVGAAHVVGEGAMAALLAERGYTVELVTG